MSKIKWKKKAEIQQENLIKEQKKVEKEQFKGKDFKNLVTKDKDKLLEILAKQAGLL